jgi:hypothetical protein
MTDIADPAPQPPAPSVPPSPIPEESPVEIHKPHAAKTWKEFFIELGTITLGICIALAGEQTVEWLHWRSQVQEAREVIATEMAFNLEGAIGRVRTLHCVEQRLDALSKILDEASRSGSLPPVGYIGQPPRHQWRSGAWESVVASQTAVHFPRQQLADLGALYKIIDRLNEYATPDTLGRSDLYPIVGPGRRLDAASEAGLRTAISRVRNTGRIMANVSGFLITQARALDLPFTPAERQQIAAARSDPLTIASQGNAPMRGTPAAFSSICEPIGRVPANYGEGPVQETPANVGAVARNLPDFGAP